MQARKTEEKRKKLVWQNAMYDASIQNGFLRVCWDESISVVSPIIYDFSKNFGLPLRALRLIGVGLTEIPEELAPNLRELEVLSLANNHITQLPENIAMLTSLKELNVMYNKITTLPSRIGYMCALEKLGVANNCLEFLPTTFGALNLLERVDLEHNCLTVLPENLDNLLSCKILNVNNNKLVRLPRCVGRMPSLLTLSASCNQLTYMPSQLTSSASLTCLRLNVNQITSIPDRFGDLTQLRELNLDYNRISKLPTTFWRLVSLKVLRMEGNDAMLDPPPEVLGKGAEAVVAHCKNIHVNDRYSRLREIVLAVQNILRQIQERELADSALFEPDTKREGTNEKDLDRWFALQLPYLWKDLLPQLKRLWEEERNARHRKKKIASDDLTTFDFTEHEAMQALTTYSDAVGPVLRIEIAKFRRCACVDQNGTRKPCVPPSQGYMCQRQCVLLKRDLVREREKNDRLWNAYKSDGIRDAVKRAQYESKLYLDSAEGQLWLEDTAYEQAEEVLLEGGANSIVEKRYRNLESKKKQLVLKYDKKKERVQRVRDQKMQQLEAELERYKEDKRQASEGYVRSAVEQRIQSLTVKLANLPETAELQQIQEECEREVARLEGGFYDSDSVNTSEVDSSDFSSEDESPAAQRWREKLARRDEAVSKKERMRQMKARFGVEAEVDNSALAMTRRAVDALVVEPLLKPLAHGVTAAASTMKKKVRRNVRQAVEVATVRTRRLFLQSNGHFDEVQRELKYEIYRQYLDHHVQQARSKAELEFGVIESVRANVEGMGRAKTFRAWKFWVVTKKRRERKDLRKRWKMATRGFDAAMHSVTSAQFQVDLWAKNKDIYSDRIYWRNQVNSKVTYDRPGLQHYLPPNFEIPIPPADLPEDVPLETSSSDDSAADDWLERYEQRRRQKRDQTTLLNLALKGTARGGDESSSSSDSDRSSIGFSNAGQSETSAIRWESTAIATLDSLPSAADLNASQIVPALPPPQESARSSSSSGSSGSGSSGSNGSSSSGSGSGSSSSVSQSESAATSKASVGRSSEATSQTAVQQRAPMITNGLSTETAVTEVAADGAPADETALVAQEDQSEQQLMQWDPNTQKYYQWDAASQYYIYWDPASQQYSYWDPAAQSWSVWDESLQQYVPCDAVVATESSDNTQQVSTYEPSAVSSRLTEDKADDSLVVPGLPPPPSKKRYNFRSKLAEYSQVFDENEEVYVGAPDSATSTKLLQAIEYAREYMRSNSLYLQRNQLLAVGGGKAASSKKLGLDVDARAATHQAIDLYAKPSDLNEQAVVIRQKAFEEYDKAFKAIRKKRNQLNVERHNTYMGQVNRKPKSLEMHRNEAAAGRPAAGSEEDLMQRITEFMTESGKVTGSFQTPSEEELLRLAGGDKDMVLTGKAGMELRTVLAQRALHVKKRLEQQAVERNLIKPKKNTTFWGREFRPLFLDKFKGSSSEEDEADEEAQVRKGKEARRRLRREKRLDRTAMSQKLGKHTNV